MVSKEFERQVKIPRKDSELSMLMFRLLLVEAERQVLLK